jgi:hypothetical protein
MSLRLVRTNINRKRAFSQLSLWTLGVQVALVLGALWFSPQLVKTADASSGYACYDQPCSEERKEYVDRWKGRVCAYSRSLNSLLRRKAGGQRTRTEILNRLNRCLARNPMRSGRCAYHSRRLRAIDRTLGDIQRRIDRLVARLQASCSVSLPNGVPGNQANCEEREALQYCPIANEQDAQRSLQQRCADLEAEKAQQALCGNCVNPNVLTAAASHSDELWMLASARPTCAPVPTYTPIATATPEPTATSGPGPTPQATATGTP